MNRVARVAIALACWIGAAAAGWWLHRPDDTPRAARAVSTTASAPVAAEAALSPRAMASSVAAADPLGLSRTPTAAPAGGAPASAAADSISWNVAALVVRGKERYVVLTSSGQQPLRVSVGQALPDGQRVKSIHADRIEIQSTSGRRRTLYLIEP